MFNTFSVHQFGIFPKRFIMQQLLVLNIIFKAIHSNKGVDILYLDFRKAFDLVSHGKLLIKFRGLLRSEVVSSVGLRLILITDISMYASKIIFLVCCQLSQVFPKVRSILGPLLFAIFINDLRNCVRINILSFPLC